MHKKFSAIIIHGSFGDPNENWFPWLDKELTKIGVSCIRPQLPTPTGQYLENWEKIFWANIKSIDENTILIGHSLAPAFILNILQQIKKPVFSTILVSPFIRKLGLPEFDRVNISFIKGPFNWLRIIKNAGKIRIFVGDNDPYVPYVAVQEVASKLNAKISVIHNGGHLNAEAGFTKFPLLLEELIKLMK
ncbi:MAG: alpha/beta hydrolase [Bacteroidetes bacterium]|nr:alpha/beta hydrolase [Bacteroidota bacterium]MCL5028883.1 alpha/beta hydrolase [Bacteroidota bacterium]